MSLGGMINIASGFTVTAAAENLVASDTEVAVMVTMTLDEPTLGAVQVVGIPLGVIVGVNEPQPFAPFEQEADQFTPPPAESFCTVAVKEAVAVASVA